MIYDLPISAPWPGFLRETAVKALSAIGVAALVVFGLMYRLPAASVGRGNMEWVAVLAVTCAVCAWIAYEVSPWMGAMLALATWYHWWPFYDHLGYTTLHNLILGAVLVYAVSHNRWAHEPIMWGLCLSCCYLVYSQMRDGHPAGQMMNQNEASAFYAYCLPAVLSWPRAVFAPVILVGLLQSDSFGGPVAAAAGLGLWAVLTRRAPWWLVLACAAAALSAYSLIDKPEVGTRLGLWQGAWDAWRSHPAGMGLGRWPTVAGKFHSGPHNEYLRLLVELGPAALLILAGFAVECWHRYRAALLVPAVGMAIAAVHGFYSFEWHIAPTAVVLALWIGMYCRKDGRRERDR